MAFYFEAEHSRWEYKQRYASWQEFPPKVCRKLEKLWDKDGEKEFKWVGPDSTSWTINVSTDQFNMVPSNRPSYGRMHTGYDIQRKGYAYPQNRGDKKKLAKLFAKYQEEDPSEPKDEWYMADQKIFNFFKDVGVNPAQVDCLILQAICGANEVLAIQQKDFVKSLSVCGCSTLKDIKLLVQQIKKRMHTRDKIGTKISKSFAKYVFQMLTDGERQKSVSLKPDEETPDQPAMALVLFQMMYVAGVKKVFPHGEQFWNFLQATPVVDEKEVKSLTRDDWTMIAEFLLTTTEAETDEDWPLIIEAYLNWSVKKQKS